MVIDVRSLVSRHLGNFLALYDTRNMHAAAERRVITQPALSKSLRVLEDELGIELFRRTAKGLEPTEEAGALYRYARAIDQEARFAAMDIRASTRELEGSLRMGIGAALAANWFALVLVNFRRDYAGIRITAETGISNHLVASLTRGLFDLVVTARPEQELPEPFVRLPLFTCAMHAVCRAGHPLRQAKPAPIADLAAFGRVGFVEDREFERHARDALGAAADKLQPLVETSSLSIMLGLLAATDHFAIVSETMLARARQSGLEPIATREPLWRIEVDLMCKAHFADSRPISAFRTAMLAAARRW